MKMNKAKISTLAVLAAATGMAGMTVPATTATTAATASNVSQQVASKAQQTRAFKFRANQRLTITPMSGSSMGGFSLVGSRFGPPTPRINNGFKRNRRVELKRSARIKAKRLA